MTLCLSRNDMATAYLQYVMLSQLSISEHSEKSHNHDYYYYCNRFTALCLRPLRWGGRRRNHSGFYWSTDNGVEVESADHMQVICTSLQIDNHASTKSHHTFTGRMLFLLPNQQHQGTEGTTTKSVKLYPPPFNDHFLSKPGLDGDHSVFILHLIHKGTRKLFRLSGTEFYRQYALPVTQPTMSRHWRKTEKEHRKNSICPMNLT